MHFTDWPCSSFINQPFWGCANPKLWRLVPARWQWETARVAAAVLGTPRRSHAAAGPSALRRPACPPWTTGGLWRPDFYPAAHTYLLSTQRKHIRGALQPSRNLVKLRTIWFYPLKAEREEKKVISLHPSWDYGGLFKVKRVLPFVVPAEKCGREAVLPVRLAQGIVAGHRVSRIGGVVGDPQPLWRIEVLAAAPLALGDARRGNGGLAGRRWGRVIPRVVAVQTLALAGRMTRPLPTRNPASGTRRQNLGRDKPTAASKRAWADWADLLPALSRVNTDKGIFSLWK